MMSKCRKISKILSFPSEFFIYSNLQSYYSLVQKTNDDTDDVMTGNPIRSEGNLLVIGISGVTCGGKTTLATQLNNILPNSKIFSQDDYFLDVQDPRHIWIPELNHINFDVITSLDMEKMHADILHFIKENNLKPISYTDAINLEINGREEKNSHKHTHDKIKESGLNVLIIEGFTIFNYRPMLNLFHSKYYLTLSIEECRKRRDTRVYEPPDCPGYFEKCVWPEYLNQLNEVKKIVKEVTYFDENSENVVEYILNDVLEYL